VLAVPVVWLLACGLGEVAGRIWPQGARVWRLVVANLVLFFALYSLLGMVLPYFYG
jgi:hypothetical protein